MVVDDGAGDKPKEACGVFGIWAPGQPVSHMVYLGLFALQHRGQESAGIAVADGDKVVVDKDMGLVSTIFDEHRLAALSGHAAIGHTRYSTTGASTWVNAQPVFRSADAYLFALAHNGNLTNTRELSAESGVLGSDSDLVAELLAAELIAGTVASLPEALHRVLPRLVGAYSLTIMSSDEVIGVRDPNGFRPLFLGRLTDGWVLASETPALDVVGATLVREVEPGEIVVIGDSGVRSMRFAPKSHRQSFCSFEHVYFARPDGVLGGQNVHRVRQRMGVALARLAPADADVVVPIPDSSVPGAQGYAQESGIPYVDGFVKNRYIGRTFIAPTPELRRRAVRIKLNPVRGNVEGKRVVVIEDSIVRGTTLRETLGMLRSAGVLEIHLRVLSPPYRWPCFYGMDTVDRSQLLAAVHTVDEIREIFSVDTLAYLDIDSMVEAIGPTDGGLCTACLTGDYPTKLSAEQLADL
ncbi:amidophosphoribosyltransferase [Nonomuraea sediminis]|uniref:amidophosphoribosyltransferase n=1 Tax=Nonomuraea sediminis TaxID=2835864 RepID=UPI001BDDB602|nr:amidophosphoribosyltransferase [Nonomuraea sediminis]